MHAKIIIGVTEYSHKVLPVFSSALQDEVFKRV